MPLEISLRGDNIMLAQWHMILTGKGINRVEYLEWCLCVCVCVLGNAVVAYVHSR